ncbi:hypothetical protein ACQWHJ_24555, partial [Salmonella enterica subsp. enterica serovar Infantis]
ISHDDHYFIHADRLLEMRNVQLTELTGDERDAASRDAVARTAYWIMAPDKPPDGSPTSARGSA